jgi:4-alpha-glucanotransferase
MFVFGFEADSVQENPTLRAASGSVASINTHDMPPFSSYLYGDDIRDRVRLGQLPPAAEADALSERGRQVHGLLDRLGTPIDTTPTGGRASAALEPALRVLARSPARFVVVSVGDLLGVRDRHNIPGTTSEHPNWRLRSPLAFEALESDDEVRQILLNLDATRRTGIGEDG